MPKISLRINSYIEKIKPSFEVKGRGWNWHAYLEGRCAITLEQLEIIPALCPKIPDEYIDEKISFSSIITSLLQYQRGREALDYLNNYRKQLELNLAEFNLMRAKMSGSRDFKDVAEFGIDFPTYRKCDFQDRANYQNSRFIVRTDKNRYCTSRILLDRKFLMPWIRTIQNSIDQHAKVEIGAIIEIRREKHEELEDIISRFLAGDAALPAPSYSLRGFVIEKATTSSPDAKS